ncbi:MAG: hypothetical protein OEM63_02835 [Gammaproteobacteria bacterium]|nr:hypothetical protein [Gammaproteobacteria bacterium]
MRPLTVITGVLLGSSLSIAFSLGAVLVIFTVLGDEHPRLDREFGPLLASFSIFTSMTVISAASFYSLVKQHPLRWLAQAAMWAGFVATGVYFWP